VATGADSPGHLTVDRPRSLAYVTNFHGERLSLIALDRDGAPAALVTTLALPAVRPGREALQSRPHCSARLHADELLVTDFGRHVVALYAIAGAGGEARLELLHALALPDGTGPRHIAYRPGSDVAYVSNELSAGVSVLRCAARRLELVEIVPSPGLGRTRALPSEIALHPRRDVVYMANRRDESISAFAPVDGRLTHRRAFDVRGRWPRHFRFTPGGELLLVANQDSDEVVSFHVTPDGDLRWTSHVLAVPTPASVWFP
jgi:6-phosphogluconolactonase